MLHSESEVRKYLESWGFNITKILEESTKTPDFLVQDHAGSYLVEVKGREINEISKLLNSHSPGEVTLTLGYRNQLSGIIDEGAEQLAIYDTAHNDFHILWFYLADSMSEKIVSRQLGATIYGLVEMEGYTNEDRFFQAPCFYFTYNAFYRLKHLNAVVIQSSNEIVLCVNEFAHRCDSFRESRLYQGFRDFPGGNMVVFDPSKLVSDNHWLVADCNISRKDSKAVLRYLGQKYSLRYVRTYNFYLVNFPL